MSKSKIVLFVAFMFLISTLLGCIGSLNTVETCVLSNEKYIDKDKLESAKQPERFESGKDIYASVRFIESPLGMKYDAKWYFNGKEVKSETKEMVTNRGGIIIFTLEAQKVTAGKLRFEILFGDDVLFSKELPIQ